MSEHLRYLFFIGPRDKLPKPLENSLVRELPGLVVQVSTDWDVLVEKAEQEGVLPSLILVDEAFGAMNPDLLQVFQDTFPNAILCLTFNGEYTSKLHIRKCLKTGIINNVIPMNLRLDLWLYAIQIMLHGGSYMPPDLVELLENDRSVQLEKARKATAASGVSGAHIVSSLTPREREVLELIARGQQNKHIAANLSLSEHTIKLHIHHIISKMGVSNRTEAAAAYLQIHRSAGGNG
ncbi:response regulator transcription factor [Roseibium aggregatum]|uniref:response regulator transcription factor n=1 Tax=Roseibium aggregatum TaxID=187304 RepID=UPI0025AC7516|nr:response regulator transcription factor [Roseibium aggregatum]WJS06054.1 response regulator transcription factor [Roseibium aggregatum]